MQLEHLPPGTQVGGYTLQRQLGAVAMGVVYLAVYDRTGETCALKLTLAPTAATTGPAMGPSTARVRFDREARLLIMHPHKHLVRGLDFGSAQVGNDEVLYLAMEYLENLQTLDQAWASNREPDWLLDRIEELFEALEHLHSKGAIHRDLKPANIGVPADGVLRVLDLGLARMVDHSITRTDTLLGSLGYMAPEQLQKAKEVDRPADLYSVGMIMVELLGGGHPLSRVPLDEVLLAILSGDMPLPPNPPPPALDGYVRKLIAVQPKDRFATAREARDKLQAVRRRMSSLPEVATTAAQIPLLGRSRLMQGLEERLERAADRDGGAVVLEGPIGSGKTRILTELSARAPLREMDVLWASSLSELAEQLGTDDDDARDLVTALADRSEETPTLLCLDNVDASAARFLTQAGRQGGSEGYLVFATTDDASPFRKGSALASSDVDILSLEELSEEYSRELAAAVLGAQTLADDLWQRLRGSVGGWPGLLIAAVKWMEAQGFVRVGHDGQAMAPELEEVTLDRTVLGRIGKWLGSRVGDKREDLEVAAILGAEFDMAELEAILERTPDLKPFEPFVVREGNRVRFVPGVFAEALVGEMDPAHRAMWNLRVADWLEADAERRRSNIGRVSRHLGESLSAGSLWTSEVRRGLEQRLGLTLSEAGKAAYEAGRYSKAADWLSRSTQLLEGTEHLSAIARSVAILTMSKLLTEGASAAEELLDKAMSVARDERLSAEERAEVMSVLAKVCMETGRIREARMILDELVPQLPNCSPSTRVRIHVNRARLFDLDRSVMSADEALEALNQALAEDPATIPPRFRMAALQQRGSKVYWITGKYEEAERDLLNALDIGGQSTSDRIFLLNALGVVQAWGQEKLSDAEHNWRQAIQLQSTLSTRDEAHFYCYRNLGLTLAWQGKIDEAMVVFEGARSVAMALRRADLQATLEGVVGGVWVRSWDFQLASTHLSLASEAANSATLPPEQLAPIWVYWGLQQLGVGKLDEAKTSLDKGRLESEKAEDQHYKWEAVRGQALFSLESNDLTSAQTSIELLKTLRRSTERSRWRLGMQQALESLLMVRMGQISASWDLMQKASKGLERAGQFTDLASSLLYYVSALRSAQQHPSNPPEVGRLLKLAASMVQYQGLSTMPLC